MAGLGNLQATTGADARQSQLDIDEMLSDALRRAGRSAFADTSFQGPLSRLMHACNTEADLSRFGRLSVRFDVMRCLKNVLRFDAAEETAPQIANRPITSPIFITGLPRSGTTFLHTLLAQDPGVATPLSWQLVYPYPSGWLQSTAMRARWVGLQFRIMEFLSPELQDLHPLSAHEPQECTDITAQVFQSLRFDSIYRIPTYQHWLEQHGHTDAYRFHRRFLQHLDGATPGRRWILKSPDHVFALDAIRTVYPDARIVFLHRDPLSVLASVAKLTEVLRRPFTNQVDRIAIGRQVCASWVDGAARMIEAAASDDSILHLHYRQVVEEPMAVVDQLYRHAGQKRSAEGDRRMQNWLRRPSHGRNMRTGYSLGEFGLDEEMLREQFRRYREAFDVAAEWNGGARTSRIT